MAWTIERGHSIFRVTAQGKLIATVGGAPYTEDDAKHATLIAAAPELVEALKAMLLHSCVADTAAEDKFDEDHLAERLARAALSKAGVS